MKIRFLTSVAGIGFAHAIGDIANFAKDEALRMIEAGHAEEYVGKNASLEEMRKHIADQDNAIKALETERDALKADIEALRDQIDMLTAPPAPEPEEPAQSGKAPEGEAPAAPSEPAAA